MTAVTRTAVADAGGGGVHLVLGPPNAGKLGRVVRWWASQRTREPLVVVPTAPDVPLVTLELVERVGPVTGHRPVVTFDGLAVAVCSSDGNLPPALEPLGEVERRFALEWALRRSPVHRLRALCRLAGGVEALGDLLREMEGSGQEPAEIVAGLRVWGTRTGGEIGLGLAELYETYRTLLSRAGRGERTDLIRQAVSATDSWSRPVACYGFVSFTPAQRELLRRLARVCPVLLSLIDDPERRWAAYFAAEVSQWTGIADSIERLCREDRAYSSPEVAALERSFLLSTPGSEAGSSAEGGAPPVEGSGATPDQAVDGRATRLLAEGSPAGGGTQPPWRPGGDVGPAPSVGGVRFFQASGRRAEAELVGRAVAALLREGVSPDNVGILVRDLGPWHRPLRRVLRAYGVPHRIDSEVTFSETGLGAALVAGMRGVSTACLEPLLAYLRSPYSGATAADVDRLELVLRDTRNVHGATMLRAARESLPDALGPLLTTLLPDEGRGAEADVEAVRLLAARMVVVAAQDRTPWSLESEEDAAAFRAADRALLQIERAGAAGWLADPLSCDDGLMAAGERVDRIDGLHPPCERVLACLRDLSVRAGRGGERGVVHVMTVARARARRFHAVFILGLADGEFPRSERVPLLLTAQQRTEANRFAGRALFSEAPPGEEVGLFAVALSRAWQLVCLSARDAEDGGEPVSPSPFWTEARRCLGVAVPAERRTLSEVVHPIDSAPSLREYLRACAQARVLPVGPEAACVVGAWGSWECRPSHLGLESLRALAERPVFSVTEIGAYARCPFAWFIGDLVGLDELEEPLDDRVLGGALHRALRGLYLSLRDERLLPLTSAGMARARSLSVQAIDEAMAALVPPGRPGDLRLLRWRVEERVTNALEYDVAAGSALAPSEFEWSLPRDGVDIGGVCISGRIDRVDGGREGEPVFVIDYKSGSGGSAPDFGSREAVQVPLYLLGLRAHDPSKHLAGGAYLYLGGPSSRGAVVVDHSDLVGDRVAAKKRYTAEAFEDLLDAARSVAEEAVGGMRAGLIPPEPPAGCPRYCELQALCRRSGGRSRW